MKDSRPGAKEFESALKLGRRFKPLLNSQEDYEAVMIFCWNGMAIAVRMQQF